MKKAILFCGLTMLCTVLFSQDFNYIKKITPPNTDSARVAGDQFGNSVSLSGNYAIIGARFADYDSAGVNLASNAGAAFIWERNTSTGVWEMKKKLTPRGTNARAASNNFGATVSISGDYCIVSSTGSNRDSSGGGSTLTNSGVAFIWERNSNGVWTQVKRISAPDRAMGDNFSSSVAISGTTAIVGAQTQDRDSANGNYKSEAGAAYIYERVNGTWGFQKKANPAQYR